MASEPTAADLRYMRLAIELATEAGQRGDVPVGALVVRDGRILGVGFNTREIDHDPTGHAEVVATREACRAARRWRLDGATLYVTLEPCPMCAGTLVNARIARLVYGAHDPKAGAVRSLYQLCEDPRLNHRLDVHGGVLADECAALLKGFFRAARARAKADRQNGDGDRPRWERDRA
ncbi:MAG TPA: tRNA adenosine(34) deaminase TadA [Enhygromyxa sp.]|nr:tRNA adenosine(34) deaminase TadA [Enhygromyxa sp.]